METGDVLRVLLQETEAYVAQMAHLDYEAHERFLVRREQLIATMRTIDADDVDAIVVRAVLQYDDVILETLRAVSASYRQSWHAIREAKKRQNAYGQHRTRPHFDHLQ